MDFEKDKDTKENGDEDNDVDEKVKSSENVSIKGGESSEKLPLSEDEENDDDDEEEDDKNNTDSKSSSAPGTDDKKKKP